MERKGRISAAENGDEMAFEGLNGTFGGVAAVDMGWSQLEIDIMVGEELAKVGGCFVV